MKLSRYIIIGLTASGLVFGGCLKTRTPVRSDEQGDEGPAETTSSKTSGAAKNGKVSRYEIEELKNEITRLSGKLEEIEHNQQTNSPADTREKMLGLENRVAEI